MTKLRVMAKVTGYELGQDLNGNIYVQTPYGVMFADSTNDALTKVLDMQSRHDLAKQLKYDDIDGNDAFNSWNNEDFRREKAD